MQPNGFACRSAETVVAPAPATPEGTAPARVDQPQANTSRPLGPRRRQALLWGVGSSALSVAGLIAFALFEQYNSMLAELRSDLKRFHETSADYAKKDQLQRIRDTMRELYKDTANASATRAMLEQELKHSERAREEMAREIQRMRERLAYLEGLRAVRPPADTDTAR